MASPFVRALRKAIEDAERQLTNMRAALQHHEQADADMEILKLKQREVDNKRPKREAREGAAQ